MELQWEKKQIPCLKQKVRQVQNQEQTLEIRLPDDFPDIARIAGCWGQPVLRGKEWRTDAFGITGGVMVWVLYIPENGSEPRVLDGWLPFQMKWNHPQSQRDGSILADILLRGVDARVLSARKMMVRAMVSALGEALEPENLEVHHPEEAPDSVQLLKRTYPVTLRMEAGEKPFRIEESLQLPGIRPEKILTCTVCPVVAEEKVMGSKAVFRGHCRVHTVYLGEDGKIYTADMESPFAQYSDLDRDYENNGSVYTSVAVSNLEWDWAEEQLQIRCGMTAQYVVCQQTLLELAEDAYGIGKKVDPVQMELIVPAILDSRREEKTITTAAPGEWTQILDAVAYMEQPVVHKGENSLDVELPGTVELLCRDATGQYHGATARFHSRWQLPAGGDADAILTLTPSGAPTVTTDGESVEIRLPIATHTVTTSNQRFPMVGGLHISDEATKDVLRPSIILRRVGNHTLWELAKQYGTTVDAIASANQLQDPPEEQQMLLIPIP